MNSGKSINAHTSPWQFFPNLTSLPLTFSAEQKEPHWIYITSAEFNSYFHVILERTHINTGGCVMLHCCCNQDKKNVHICFVLKDFLNPTSVLTADIRVHVAIIFVNNISIANIIFEFSHLHLHHVLFIVMAVASSLSSSLLLQLSIHVRECQILQHY